MLLTTCDRGLPASRAPAISLTRTIAITRYIDSQLQVGRAARTDSYAQVRAASSISGAEKVTRQRRHSLESISAAGAAA